MGFNFNISLSVLNSLGRDLYRNFISILGEAISNSWDADAKNVWITIDRDNRNMRVLDDGDGMDALSFQNQFLKIGYSKRRMGNTTPSGRPFIGRKGIGKLALLSCSRKLHVASKVNGGKVIGGIIDNSDLDKAITNDVDSQEYELGEIDSNTAIKLNRQKKGTLIFFDQLNASMHNTVDKIKKLIALNFKFILFDRLFNIYVNGIKITLKEVTELINNTQFIWTINGTNDPFSKKIIKRIKNRSTYRCFNIESKKNISGFIASVIEPKHLKITGLDEKVSIDIFSNGRLREKDILKRIQSARVVPQYLYGQIDFNELDSNKENFTANREGIKMDSEQFNQFFTEFKKFTEGTIFSKWDTWRREISDDGDPDNSAVSKAERAAISLFNKISKDFASSYGTTTGIKKKIIDELINKLKINGTFNGRAYLECFIAENLLRSLIKYKKIKLDDESKKTAKRYKENERKNKAATNIPFDVRVNERDLICYLDFYRLAKNIDKISNKYLSKDDGTYRVLRNAIAHTAILSKPAQAQFSICVLNIKSKIESILKESKKDSKKIV